MKDSLKISFLKEALFKAIDPYYGNGAIDSAVQAFQVTGYPNIAKILRKPRYTQEYLNELHEKNQSIGSVGIAITTQNRHDYFVPTYENIVKHSNGCKIVVVDDASDIPCKQATFRFNEVAGIAKAKNKCFELLSDCDYIFLFDDDCYPKLDYWYLPYILSEVPHMMYLFDCFRYKKDYTVNHMFTLNDTVVHAHAKGCMLFYHRRVIEDVGGMDENFGRWGGEHADLSDRIFYAGYTDFPYMDLDYSFDLIYSADEYCQAVRSLNDDERTVAHAKTQAMYNEKADNREATEYIGSGDVVMAHILTSQPDPQRGAYWESSINVAGNLVKSVREKSDAHIVIFTDFMNGVIDGVEYVQYPKGCSPLFYKWFITYNYLRTHKPFRNVFIVDSNDVEMLNNPFPYIKENTLYVGTDAPFFNMDYNWMRSHSGDGVVNDFICNSRHLMLNSGIVGGSYKMVMHFIRLFIFWYVKLRRNVGERNMPLFNYIIREKWKYGLDFGPHVTTEFKKEERTNAWWKHK